jgi:hypothetical protein
LYCACAARAWTSAARFVISTISITSTSIISTSASSTIAATRAGSRACISACPANPAHE